MCSVHMELAECAWFLEERSRVEDWTGGRVQFQHTRVTQGCGLFHILPAMLAYPTFPRAHDYDWGRGTVTGMCAGTCTLLACVSVDTQR